MLYLYTLFMLHLRFITFIVTGLIISSTIPTAFAATLTIEQTTQFDTYGTMSIIDPENSAIDVEGPLATLDDITPGSYTVIISPPAGTDTETQVFINGLQLQSAAGARFSFKVEKTDVIQILINHKLVRTGTVALQTDPVGIPFVLKGPDAIIWEGVTPMQYERLPIGQYTAQFISPEGCKEARPLSDRVEKSGRINFTLKYDCVAADKLRQQEYDRVNPEHFSIIVEGAVLQFTDLDRTAWYTPYISQAVNGGILSGYTDSAGNTTNMFGPADSVNLAQLAKVAHKLGGISMQNIRNPVQNLKARGQWFEQYFASAELKKWLPYVNTANDPARPATRAEVVSTILQALDQEVRWPTATYFTDVGVHTPYSYAIEQAAIDGLIETSIPLFRPQEPINRAELAKLISKAIELYILN
jgi:hypothetical protein